MLPARRKTRGKAARPREFHAVIERDEAGYYVASVPELPGCHTQAKSLDKLMERVREAIGLCLEVAVSKRARLQPARPVVRSRG